MPNLLNEQEGGKVEPQDKNSGGADPDINPTAKTIDMKIRLVAGSGDDALPSYLVPKLNCTKSDGSNSKITLNDGSKVKVTLSGANLEKKTPTPTDFKCEITSNFLNEKEKSAITIETYYTGDKVSTIYFDESLLRYYKNKQLIESPNPFSVDLDTADSTDGNYIFNFDFNTIITEIQKLPSYTLIQNMFMFVNSIDNPPPPPQAPICLLKISADAFLNLTFKGVPFIGEDKFVLKGLTLKIDTTQPSDASGCTFDSLPDDIKLAENLKKVLELAGYEFNCTNLLPKATFVAKNLSSSATTAIDKDVKDYEYALKEYNNAITSGDEQRIQHTKSALATALKKTGMAEHLINKKASVPAGSLGKNEIDKTYDAKISISRNTSAKADHSKEFNIINNNLKNQHVKEHFDLGATSTITLLQQQQQSTGAAAAAAVGANVAGENVAGANVAGAATKATTTKTKSGASFGGTSLIHNIEGSACSNGDIGVYCDRQNEVMRLEVPYSMIINTCFEGKLKEALLGGNGPGKAGGGGEESLEQLNNKELVVTQPVNENQNKTDVGGTEGTEEGGGAVSSSKSIQNKPAAATRANAAPAPPAIPISNINEIKNSGSEQTFSGITPDMLVNQGKQLLIDFEGAIIKLSKLDTLVTSESLNVAQIPELQTAKDVVEEANKLKNNIIENATSVTTIAAAVATSGASLIKLAPEAINAYTKIQSATKAVDTAENAVNAAIAAKKNASPPANDDDDGKIQELTDKLDAAKKSLELKKKLLSDSTNIEQSKKPDPAYAENALTAGDTAIKATESAASEKKAALIKTAESLVNAAESAVNDFSSKVEAAAAAAGKPTGNTEPNYAAYEAACIAYDSAKKAFEAANSEALEKASESGGDNPNEQIEAAKTALRENIAPIDIDPKYSNIKKIPNETEFNKQAETGGAIQEEIKKLTEATEVYKTYLQFIEGFVNTYNQAMEAAAAASAAASEAGASGDGAPASAEKQERARVKAEKEAKITGLKQKIKDLTTQIGQIKPDKEDGELNDEQEQQRADLQKQLDATRGELVSEESSFPLFDGGSKPKPKSKSSSSKSSSKSKSKPKNKTKKNHSKSKSNKSKTPKIIMNE